MKQFHTFIPALIFSAGTVIYISNADTSFYKNTQEQRIQNEGTGITGRREWELMRLRDPETGLIPVHIRRKELAYASTLPGYVAPSQTQKINALTWTSRGPWKLGGRTRAFAIDISNPTKFLAGSTSGGMWTSTNAGTSWTQNWTAVHQSVTCIAQDARAGKTNTWYIGTGEGYGQSASGGGSNAYYLGNGMYKSTDGGQTWNSLTSTSSNTPQTFDNVWDIIWNTATDPSEPTNDEVYAASYGAIMRSTNGGTTWAATKGSASASPFSYFTDVAVDTSGVVYATLSSDGAQKGIYRSSNGTTWTNITPAGFPTTYGRIKIGISPSDQNQVYFWAGVTTGAGMPDTNFIGQIEWNSLWKYQHDAVAPEWFDLSSNLPTTGGPFDKQHVQGGYDMLIKVHPTDTNIVFLGGTNLYRSTNGFKSPANTTYIGGYQQGATLPLVDSYLNHHSDQHELIFDSSNPTIMYSANDGGIFKTTDNTAATVAWTPLNNGYITSMFYTVALDHASPGDSTIIGGAQDNGTWYENSTDPQATWVHPRGGDGSYCFIANNKSDYYFSIQNGKMMKATLNTAGTIQTFARIDPIGGTGYLFINPYVLDQNNNNIMYLAGGKNLWRNDALNTIPMAASGNWDTISTGWTKFPDTIPTANAKITALAVSKSPANILYYGTSNKSVYRIDNANTGTPTAIDITGTGTAAFPAGYVSSIAIDPLDAGNVMVSFSNYGVYSIYYSTNADSTAPTWTKVAGNLEQNSNTSGAGTGPSVRWVSIMPVSDGTVYLAATSTGLYATNTLSGTSTLWDQQGATTIGNSICDMIDFRSSDGLVAIATHSHGIFTSHITSVNDVTSAPTAEQVNFQLSNYPNPFSNSTIVSFTLRKNSKVRADIYDLSGKLLHTIADKEFSSGTHRLEFSGEHLSTGIYYCILRTGEMTETRKMIVLK